MVVCSFADDRHAAVGPTLSHSAASSQWPVPARAGAVVRFAAAGTPGCLLVPQGLNRIEASGAEGRVDTGNQTDATGEAEAQGSGPYRDRGREVLLGHRGNRGGATIADRYAKQPAHPAQCHGLREELKENIAPLRAHRFPNAD